MKLVCIMRSEFKNRVVEKALSRVEDELRLASSEASRDQLQKENSVVRGSNMEQSEVLHWG